MNEEFPQQTKLVFASANVADPRGPLRLYAPDKLGNFVQSMTDATDDAIFDGGVELHPIMDMWTASPRHVAEAVTSRQLTLHSLHASFRATRRSRDMNVFPDDIVDEPSLASRVVDGAMASPIGRLLMPEVVNSSRYMARVQAAVGRELPVVLYPQRDAKLDAKARGAVHSHQKLIQPTDHVARIVDARTPEEFVEKLIISGKYNGFVLDTFHVQRQYGRDEKGVISDLKRSLPVLAPYIQAGHLSLGRDDMTAHEAPDLVNATANDLVQALNGEANGATKEMLQLMRELHVGYIALEATATSLNHYVGSGQEDLQSGFASIGAMMQDYVGS